MKYVDSITYSFQKIKPIFYILKPKEDGQSEMWIFCDQGSLLNEKTALRDKTYILIFILFVNYYYVSMQKKPIDVSLKLLNRSK